MNEVKARFEKNQSLDKLKGITPEMRYLFIVLSLQRDNFRALQELKKLKLSEIEKAKRIEEFNKTLPGRLLQTIEGAGGKLVRFNIQGKDKIVVVWKVGDQTVNSLINLDFRILEAGYCLEGEDKKHSLSSAVTLAQSFQEERPLYITRE